MNLNPGSPDAVDMGCRCPIMDNHYGRGIPCGDDEPKFWVTPNCPLHGKGGAK